MTETPMIINAIPENNHIPLEELQATKRVLDSLDKPKKEVIQLTDEEFQSLPRAQKRQILRRKISVTHYEQSPEGPRRSRRSKLLPSGLAMRKKTRKLRSKFRGVGNEKKVLIVAK